MEFLSEQERYQAGVLPHDFLQPLIAEVIEQESSVPIPQSDPTSGTCQPE